LLYNRLVDQLDIRRGSGSYGNVTVLEINGPLTLRNLFEFQNAVRQPGITDTILDLAGVPFIDSAGLGAILSHYTHTQKSGNKFAVTGATDRVQMLFRITKVNSVLPSFATVRAAGESFAALGGAASMATS
jgi:anti-sigma B factor antagonist